MCDSLAKLATIETTLPDELSVSDVLKRPDPDVPADIFRHSGWRERREKVFEALKANGSPHRRIARFAGCGAQAWLLKSTEHPSTYRFVPDFCHDRWCIPCQNARGARLAANVLESLKGRATRFLMLTVRGNEDPLVDRINFILTAFRRLRRTDFWNDRVVGGAAFLELTRGAAGDHWHVHLHVILEGCWIDKPDLEALWSSLTGGSFKVGIKKVKDERRIAWYVAKYTAKPIDTRLHNDPARLCEAIAALRGRKLVHCFGSWQYWQLLRLPTAKGWMCYAHINEILYREICGQEEAHDIIMSLLYMPGVAQGVEFATVDEDERGPPHSDMPPAIVDGFRPSQLLLLP